MKRKCRGCDQKINKNFNFCPHCGFSVKKEIEEKDFGLLGREDNFKEIQNELKLPLGLNKIMNSLLRDLTKELSSVKNSDSGATMPRGFSIQISTSSPKDVQRIAAKENCGNILSKKEIEKRNSLPKQEAKSSIKRLSDRLICEISVPGVKSKKDIVIAKLENGIEIRGYSKDSCYVKNLPVKLELMRANLKDNVLVLEFKA